MLPLFCWELLMNALKRLFLLSAVVALAGCAATVQRGANEAKLVVPEASSKKVVMEISGKTEWASDAKWGYLRDEWQNSMNWAANNAKIAYAYRAPGAAPAAAEAATLVKIKVNDFRFVSTAARWGLGIFSGNAFVDADVSFVDLQTGRELGTRKYSSASSALQGVFAPMTERQLEVINTEIVKEVTQR
jgi:hypothetical protein